MKDNDKNKILLDQDENLFPTLESFETSVIDLVGDISFAETNRFTKNIRVLNQPKNIIFEAEIVRVSTPVRQKKLYFLLKL